MGGGVSSLGFGARKLTRPAGSLFFTYVNKLTNSVGRGRQKGGVARVGVAGWEGVGGEEVSSFVVDPETNSTCREFLFQF